jgi:hypothetical protein
MRIESQQAARLSLLRNFRQIAVMPYPKSAPTPVPPNARIDAAVDLEKDSDSMYAVSKLRPTSVIKVDGRQTTNLMKNTLQNGGD